MTVCTHMQLALQAVLESEQGTKANRDKIMALRSRVAHTATALLRAAKADDPGSVRIIAGDLAELELELLDLASRIETAPQIRRAVTELEHGISAWIKSA